MSYFKAKKDLALVLKFKPAVHQFWTLEDQAKRNVRQRTGMFDVETPTQERRNIREEGARLEGYGAARSAVARGSRRVIELCYFHGIPIQAQSFPPPLIGGPVIPVNYIAAILEDTSYAGIDKAVIDDRLNQLIGKCEEWVETTRRRLLNPFYWLYEAIAFILRIPFRLVEMTGFDVAKFEDQIWAKLFRLVELGVIVWFLYRLGATNAELRKFIMGIFGKSE
jgi:hypothetical protein